MDLPADVIVEKWSNQDISSEWTSKTIMLVVNPELNEPMAIDGSRIVKEDAVGAYDRSSIAISDTLAGSAVTDAETGNLVGMLTKTNGVWMVAR